MKKILSLCLLVLLAGCIKAQNKNIQNLPVYHILTTDSVRVTSANLKKNKPVMFIYFSPDCSHCQHLMYEMKPHMKELKNVQVVMITFVEQFKMIKEFYRDFDLAKYPNFTVGTEGYTYEMQRFFDIKTTPYIAIYDKNGKLFKAYEKAPSMKDLIESVNKV